MSKLKKVLFMGATCIMVAALAIGGTLAYLTSTDSDVNVMTVGNVKIAQHEYERVVDENGEYKIITVTKADGSTQQSYELQEFTQAKPLYPAVGDPNGGYTETYVRFEQLDDPAKVQGGQQMHKVKNAQDKLVLVENTGRSDAYVRTLIAFEAGSYSYEEWQNVIVKFNGNDGEPWKYTDIETPIAINGNNYIVVEAVYTGYSYGNMRHNGGILPAGDWTYNNLAQVYMASTATNEDVIALDGNNNGTYDILVLSQAVQTEGFKDAETALETAFPKGENNANVPAWFEGLAIPVVVKNAEELQEASFAHATKIVLANDVTIEEGTAISFTGNMTYEIDLNGYKLGGDGFIMPGFNGTINFIGSEEDVTCGIFGRFSNVNFIK